MLRIPIGAAPAVSGVGDPVSPVTVTTTAAFAAAGVNATHPSVASKIFLNVIGRILPI
jgi:hypothetical protein